MANNLDKLNTLPDDLRADLSARVNANWDEIFKALLELAKGAYFEDVKETNDGAKLTRIYRRLPDKEVAQYLANQIIGKPKENLTLQGKVNFIMTDDSMDMPLDSSIIAPLIEKRPN